jgi:hypothetical protein
MVDPVKFGRVICAGALLLVPVAPAAAQESGVHVDPDSPAGKEYAIPIEQARRQAAGASTSKDGGRASGDAALFGAGIAPRSGGRGSSGQSGGGTGGGGSSGSNPSGGGGSKGASGGQAANTAAARRALAVASSDSGSSATFQTAAIALAVLLAGGLIGGVMLRLNRGRAD